MVKIKKRLTIPSVEGYGATGTNTHCWWECKSYAFMHSYTSHFTPRYLPQKNENESTKSYTWMYIAALLEMAQTWKQANYPSTGEWLNELWYSHTRYCPSATKKKQQHGWTSKWLHWMKKARPLPSPRKIICYSGNLWPQSGPWSVRNWVPGQLETHQERSSGWARETSSAAPHHSHYCLNHPLTPKPFPGAKNVGDHCTIVSYL